MDSELPGNGARAVGAADCFRTRLRQRVAYSDAVRKFVARFALSLHEPSFRSAHTKLGPRKFKAAVLQNHSSNP